MFDIGFWELVLTGIVLLLVVGPEKLPPLVEMVGRFVGRFQRHLSSVRTELTDALQPVAESVQQLSEIRDVSVIESDQTRLEKSVNSDH